MNTNASDSKPLYYSFIIFLFFILLTVGASLYLNYEINGWIKKLSTNISSSAVTLVESRFNQYKLNYYGLMNLSKTIEPKSLDLLSATSSAKNTLNVFGEVNFVSYVQNYGTSKQIIQTTYQPNSGINPVNETASEIQDKKFNTYLASAFAENKPVFYTRLNQNSHEYIASIIPIDASSKSFYFVDIEYSNLFYSVNKSNLLTNNLHILIEAFDLNKQLNKPVYASEDLSQAPMKTRKFYSNDSFMTKDLQLDMVKLKLSFTEVKNQTIATILRQIPFTASVIGIIISVMVFCVAFFIQLAYRMHSSDK